MHIDDIRAIYESNAVGHPEEGSNPIQDLTEALRITLVTLDNIHDLLDGKGWDSDTNDAVGREISNLGYPIHGPGEEEVANA